jgi:hypothetical protein
MRRSQPIETLCERIRLIIDYMGTLPFMPSSMMDPKQRDGSQMVGAYGHHPMMMSSKGGSIMNGYPLQPQP